MSKIVFSEGKRDVRFVRKFFDRYHDNPRIDPLVIENVSKDEMRNRESNKIRRFLDGWNDYNLLVKSENGKPNLKAGFSSVVRHLANKPVEKYVLVDLDTTEIDGFVDDIRERVRQRHQGTGLRIGDAEQVCRCREMVAKEVALENDRGSDPRTGFTVLAFRDNLEVAAGIDKDEDDPEDEAEKLASLLDGGSFDRLLQRTLL
ncbi:hypothetical protein [Halorussus caseinilyticus]|uniref:hypothetical protein n=1 Tax=Halorussus caseinilyticus TaxID=3034025 RepID=UPI0023E89C4E|nr:hypothetical protein [Halorussus sp. DT72]